MSGIAAVCQRKNASFNPAQLDAMIQQMSHRGPDGRGSWSQGKMGLASCLLRVTPEAHFEEPVTANDEGSLHLVWDGRIDNREELLSALSSDHPAKVSDPTIFLESYRQWGTDCLKQMIGEFAFVLWDDKQQVLFAGRDRIGVKPLYYTTSDQAFYFSSEVKPLFEALGRMPQPEDEIIFSFLAYANFYPQDHHRTFFKEIQRLAPGHFLLIKDDKLEISRYWSLDPKRILQFSSEEDYSREFRKIFKKAVKCRLRAANPTALFLSGGLDSSAIAGIASEDEPNLKSRLQAVNIYSDDPESDERSFAREIAAQTGIRLHELFSRTHDPLKNLGQTLWDAEFPILDISPNREPYEFIQERGMKAVLSGVGGDQLMDEDGFPADLIARGRFLKLWRTLFRFAKCYKASPLLFIRESLPLLVPQWLKNLRRRIFKNTPPLWLNHGASGFSEFKRRLFNPGPRLPFHSFVQENSWQNVMDPYMTFKLEIDDRIYARHGLEIRYPFLDSRLVEFVLALPWPLRAKGERKWILRQSLKSLLPARVFERKGKGGFTNEMDEVLQSICRLPLLDLLANQRNQIFAYWHPAGAEKLVKKYLNGQKDLRWHVWFLIAMDQWLQQFNPGVFNEKRQAREETKIHSSQVGTLR